MESLSNGVSMNLPYGLTALAYYAFVASRRFNPRLPIIESVHRLEASGVSGFARSVNVMPTARIAGASESFVENVEFKKPSSV